jgi:hypothetical protein
MRKIWCILVLIVCATFAQAENVDKRIREIVTRMCYEGCPQSDEDDQYLRDHQQQTLQVLIKLQTNRKRNREGRLDRESIRWFALLYPFQNSEVLKLLVAATHDENGFISLTAYETLSFLIDEVQRMHGVLSTMAEAYDSRELKAFNKFYLDLVLSLQPAASEKE